MPSYHDLHITTAEIPRTSIFNLPYGLEVRCSRTCGWEVFDMNRTTYDPRGRLAPIRGVLLAGEYDEAWLVLDVAGHVIIDSRRNEEPGNTKTRISEEPLAAYREDAAPEAAGKDN